LSKRPNLVAGFLYLVVGFPTLDAIVEKYYLIHFVSDFAFFAVPIWMKPVPIRTGNGVEHKYTANCN
jgi:hypothetical protein